MNCLFSCVFFLALQQSFELHPASLSPLEGEKTASFAFQKAKDVAQLTELTLSGNPILRLQETSTSARHWNVLWPDCFEANLDSRSGALIKLTNWVKQDQVWSENVVVQPPLALPTADSSRAEVRRLLGLFGVPENVRWSREEIMEGNDGRPAHVYVYLNAMYRNRPVTTAEADITVDRKDKRILSFRATLAFVVETLEPVLSVSEARTKAVEIYKREVLPSDRYPISQETPQLVYRRPGRGYGSTGYPVKETPMRVRIAYLFGFGPDRVSVDAVNGTSLGGGRWPQRPGR